LAGPGAQAKGPVELRLRLDKWLWQARFFRARSIAAEAIATGSCRVNGQRITRPGYAVATGDVLTFVTGNRVRLIRVAALGVRRGPASEAVALYVDLDPSPAASGPSDPAPEDKAPA
jgi:ribosome-associated heat shock protein Hsp15